MSKPAASIPLTFKYSPDLPGYIDCVLISVDPDTDDKDDEIIFSPDPAVISEGFDIAEIQKYVSGEKKYRILAFSELTRFTVSVGDKSYDALNGTTEGITLEPVDKYNVRLTLSDAFFASCQAGDQEVTFRIEDANGGSSEVATTYRLEGLVPVTADDYDLWANTVTLRVVSFTPGTTVQFGLRSSGGEWQPMAGTSQGDDFITATYAPQWEEKTTADWSTPATVLPYSRLKRAPAYRQAIRTTTKRRSARRNSAAGSRPLRAHPCPTEAWNRGETPSNSRVPAPTIPSGAAATTRSPRNSVPVTRRCRDASGHTVPNCPRHIIRWPRFPHRATYSRETSPSRFSAGWAATSLSAKVRLQRPPESRQVQIPRYDRGSQLQSPRRENSRRRNGQGPDIRLHRGLDGPTEVFAGTKAPTGTWDPETQTEAANGPIIGYASKFIEETTQGDEMVEVILPINYYQDTAAAPDGKYNIVVSCSTSAYGDYMDACTTNVMYVDDF